VLVHVDAERLETPEDRRPPLRTRILSDLEDAWKDIPEAALAQRITLHYRNDKVDAELLLTADTLAPDQLGPLGTRLEKAAGGLNYLRDVRVLLTPA
jgi:hypothetical protein